MAGEWMKIELGLPNKPKVFKIARILGFDRDIVVGKLVRLWAWFDNNSVDGAVDGVLSTDVDALVDAHEFCVALQSVNWIEFDDDLQVIKIPNFYKHNGESAKKRVLKSDRQQRWRSGSKDVDASASTDVDAAASHREDKIRDIKELSKTAAKAKKHQTQLAVDFKVSEDNLQWALANFPTLDLQYQTERFSDYYLAKGARYSDWQLTWKNWIKRTVADMPKMATGKSTRNPTVHDKRAAVAESMYGNLARELEDGQQQSERNVSSTSARAVTGAAGDARGGGQVVLEDGVYLRQALARPMGERTDGGSQVGMDDSDLEI